MNINSGNVTTPQGRQMACMCNHLYLSEKLRHWEGLQLQLLVFRLGQNLGQQPGVPGSPMEPSFSPWRERGNSGFQGLIP